MSIAIPRAATNGTQLRDSSVTALRLHRHRRVLFARRIAKILSGPARDSGPDGPDSSNARFRRWIVRS
jgi:hypothetical protein